MPGFGLLLFPHRFSPECGKGARFDRKTMPQDLKQLRSLLKFLVYHRNFLIDMSKRIYPIMPVLKMVSSLCPCPLWKPLLE